MPPSEQDYRTLGLDPDASLEEIRQAYRDLMRVWHPDRFAHDPRLLAKADMQCRAINAVYEGLTKGREEHTSPPEPPPADTPTPPATTESRRPSQRESGSSSAL